MTAWRLKQLLRNFKGNPPAEATAVARLEAQSGIRLPRGYKDFLQYQNGGEGYIGNSYATLWPAEQLLEMNKNHKVAERAPGLFLFGSYGGGEALAFDTRTEAGMIVSVPFLGMGLREALPVASGFDNFLEELSNSRSRSNSTRSSGGVTPQTDGRLHASRQVGLASGRRIL